MENCVRDASNVSMMKFMIDMNFLFSLFYFFGESELEGLLTFQKEAENKRDM